MKAIDYCVANGTHLIIPSLGDYSWYRRAVMCAFHDILLKRRFSFTVLDRPDGCSSDDIDRLKATVSKFRRQSEIISVARQKISRDLSLTGKYTTKHRDRHVITREPGGAIRGSRVLRKLGQMDASADMADDAGAEREQGDAQSTELQDDEDDVAFVSRDTSDLREQVVIREMGKGEPRINYAEGSAAADATARGTPQLVYRWDLTKAIIALIAKSEAFARNIKPHILAAAEGAFSLKEIARRLDEQGIRTVTGKTWNNVVLSQVIQRGVIMGLKEYRQLHDRFITQPGQSARQRKKRTTSP